MRVAEISRSTLKRALAAVAAVAALSLGQSTGQAATAMIAYGKTGSTTPYYRMWNGTAWGAEAAAKTVGSIPQWLVLRGSPVTNNFFLVTLDDSMDIEAQEWNGTAWGNVFQATSTCGTTSRRAFDLAYEQASGHALLVYRVDGSSAVRYRTYDGTTMSNEMTYSMTTSYIRWLQLVPKPGTDEIMLIAISNYDTVHKAAMWNGSAFVNQVSMVGIDEPDTRREHAEGAFEGLSGQGLLAYNQDSNMPGYRTLTGGVWSSSLNAPSVGAQTQWTRMASDPVSDRIIMATLDQSNDVNLTVWSGSAWGVPLQIESAVPYTDRRAIDVAYQPQGTKAMVVYEDNTNALKYRIWDGFGWTGELSAGGGGNSPLWNPQAVSGLTSSQIFVTYCSENGAMRTATWNGSAMGAWLNLGVISGNKEHECFMVALAGDGAGAPKVTMWKEIKRQ